MAISTTKRPPNPILQRLTRGERFPNLAWAIVLASLFAVALTTLAGVDLGASPGDIKIGYVVILLVLLPVVPLLIPVSGALSAAFTARDLASEDSRLLQLTPVTGETVFDGYAWAALRRMRWPLAVPIIFWPLLSVIGPYVGYYFSLSTGFKTDLPAVWYTVSTSLVTGAVENIFFFVNVFLAIAAAVAIAIWLRKPAAAAWAAFGVVVVLTAAAIGLLFLPLQVGDVPVSPAIVGAAEVFLIWGARRLAVRWFNRSRAVA